MADLNVENTPIRSRSDLPDSEETAGRILRTHRVAVMILAYNAEKHIHSVLERIPGEVSKLLSEIFVIDDFSDDRTFTVAVEAGEKLGLKNLRVFRTPANQGYGGSQKIGYSYAINHGFDFVVMLHGDGQYAPECLPQLIAPFIDDRVDVVLGSRMLRPRDALRGGMPLYKWLGNRLLTWIENRALRVSLSEFHTGYRAFRTTTLKQIPFRYNSDVFHFDTEILIQFVSAGCMIREVPIPTHYGDEICHVNGLRYGFDCVRSVVRYRLFTVGLFYDPLLDFQLFECETYFFKRAPNSLHQYILRQGFSSDECILDLGAAGGYMSAAIAGQAGRVVAVDRELPRNCGTAVALSADIDGDFDVVFDRFTFDTVLALDVIEHLEKPEAAVQKIGRLLKPGGRVMASTGNIAFFAMRIMLFIGFFNYGKRGILDSTHRRLFTVTSFRDLFNKHGFEVELVRGFGPPIRDLISPKWPFSWIDSMLSSLAKTMPRLFSYSFLLVARRLPSLEEVYETTTNHRAPEIEAKQLEFIADNPSGESR